MSAEDYELVVAGPVARAIAEQLPEAVAIAVIEFLTGPLVVQPHRIGTPLRRELAGLHSARRGTFRILYRIDDECRVVTVVRVEHRSGSSRLPPGAGLVDQDVGDALPGVAVPQGGTPGDHAVGHDPQRFGDDPLRVAPD